MSLPAPAAPFSGWEYGSPSFPSIALRKATAASGEATTGYPQDDGMGRLVQGQLEGSNVEIVQEMVDMISAQRAYELNSKAIKAADEMSQTATDMVR